MASFKFHSDPGLTTELSGPITFQQAADGSTGPATAVVYLGSNDAGVKIQADSDPGIDQIAVAIVDTAGGSGSAATDFELSADGSSWGATGASLNLGTQVLSLPANCKPIHIRCTDSTGTVGAYADCKIQLNTVREVPQ